MSANAEAPVRVVLCDDHAAMRTAFRSILESAGVEVVGEAADGAEVVDVVRRTLPDVVLMDARMPHRDGLAATRDLTEAGASPRVAVMVLTTFDDDAVVFGALEAGAAGFVLKNAPPEEIVAAVRRVAAGDAVLDPTVTRRVFARFAEANDAGRGEVEPLADPLTEREKDVWWLLAQGNTNAEVALRLGIGEETAKTHVARVLQKLGVRDRVQAVIRAYESGFADTDRSMA